jgi:hypothetical protein
MGIGLVSVMQGRVALVGIRNRDLKVIRPDGSMDTVAPFPKDPRQLVASDLFIGNDRGMVVKSEGRIYVIEANARIHRLNPVLTLSVPRIVAALTDATPNTIDQVVEREEARFLLSRIYDGLETWGHAASDLEKSQLDRSIARGTLMQLTTLNSRMRKVLNAFQKRKESWPDSVSPVGLLLKVFASCDLHLRGDTGA